MALCNYVRPSASCRVRIGLALKGLDCDYKPVHLAKNAQQGESCAAASAARLVPQILNAQRFECRIDHVPNVMRVFEACMRLPAFERRRPEHCPDFE